jgi:hypothetical protein
MQRFQKLMNVPRQFSHKETMSVCNELKISQKQFKNWQNHKDRMYTQQNLTEWIENHKNPIPGKGHIIGVNWKENSRCSLVISSDEILDLIRPVWKHATLVCIDGDHEHIKTHTLLMIGFILPNHIFVPFAWGLITGSEGENEVNWFITLVMQYLKKKKFTIKPTNKCMLHRRVSDHME